MYVLRNFGLTGLAVIFVLAGATATAQTKIPEATIVTDPGMRVEGTWGGESDGKTIGIDGNPLANHKIYSIDTHYFCERIKIGIMVSMSSGDRERYNELKRALRPLDKAFNPVGEDSSQRQRSLAEYARKFSKSPKNEPFYKLAQCMAEIECAALLYDHHEGMINYEEQLRVKDRIDLDQAPTAAGRRHREIMKAAIEVMAENREAILKDNPQYYEIGQKQMELASKAIRDNEKFAKVLVQDAQLFAYQSFERTPMAQGLATAHRGGRLLSAKPIFLPMNAKVQILEEQTIDVPEMGVSGLPVMKIRIKSDGMRQHDGKALSMFTLEGWVLKRQILAE